MDQTTVWLRTTFAGMRGQAAQGKLRQVGQARLGLVKIVPLWAARTVVRLGTTNFGEKMIVS